jgi:hypothetical protein
MIGRNRGAAILNPRSRFVQVAPWLGWALALENEISQVLARSAWSRRHSRVAASARRGANWELRSGLSKMTSPAGCACDLPRKEVLAAAATRSRAWSE